MRLRHGAFIAACTLLCSLNFLLLFTRLPGLGGSRKQAPDGAASAARPGLLTSLRSFRRLQERPEQGPHEEVVRLSTGAALPLVGFGTAGLGEGTAAAVGAALEAGYRLFDSAQAREWYREDEVGRALQGGGVPRGALFLTSKLHPRHLGFNRTLAQFRQSLADLRTPYLDLFLLHYPRCWPALCPPGGGGGAPGGTWQASWQALEALQAQGLARAIGVSNFAVPELEELLSLAKVRPAVVQARSDPLASDQPLRAFCARHGIQFQGYSTLGTQWALGSGRPNPVLAHPTLRRLAARHGCSPAQVALRWALQTGQAVVPRSASPAHMAANRRLAFQLSPGEMAALAALDGAQPWLAATAAD